MGLKNFLNGTIAREPTERHQYPVFIISSSINLYGHARCGFRSAVDIPNYVNESFVRKPEKIPGQTVSGIRRRRAVTVSVKNRRMNMPE
ncbi:hypothetical protein Barb4_01055 [Bacteroidales bacterium Barb4]|nr:hypothetical protein Barb4_01055 [Bacteroidales bacterium Barb4]